MWGQWKTFLVPLLFKLEARQSPPLPWSRKMCAENGPLLPLVSSLSFPGCYQNHLAFLTRRASPSCSKALFRVGKNLTNLIAYRVGGVVSETSFKFFVQFIAWTAAYCLFTLILMAITISELRQEVRQCCNFPFSCLFSFAQGLYTKTKDRSDRHEPCSPPSQPWVLCFFNTKLI